MCDIPRPDSVPSNVSICIDCELHQVGWIRMRLNARRIKVDVDGELLKVGVICLQSKLTGNRDGAGKRTESIDCFLLDCLRSVNDSGGDACFARPTRRKW